MDNPKKEKCPMCMGSGEIKGAIKTAEMRKRRHAKIAKTLRADGYSIREIMKLMGYRSTRSVSLLLEK